MQEDGCGHLYCCIQEACCELSSFYLSLSSELINITRIMHPGTVHSVTTLQDCVAVGGHFFSISTMKYSIYSAFHTFVASHTITNVPIDAEQQMLLRIILFWHKAMCNGEVQYLNRVLACGPSGMHFIKISYRELIEIHPESFPHIPNILNLDDFEHLVMLLNYAELVLVVTPSRYDPASSISFRDNLYRKPRECSRALRRWILKHFELTLDGSRNDEYTNSDRLESLMLKSLVQQAHLLWHSVQNRDALGVLGSTYLVQNDGSEWVDQEISAEEVAEAITNDLSSFPGFTSAWKTAIHNSSPPASYRWPQAPKDMKYIVRFKD